MAMSIEGNSAAQHKLMRISTDEDLHILLENMIAIIERLWREEVHTKTYKKADTPRKAVLRKAHKVLAEWFEFETLRKQGCA